MPCQQDTAPAFRVLPIQWADGDVHREPHHPRVRTVTAAEPREPRRRAPAWCAGGSSGQGDVTLRPEGSVGTGGDLGPRQAPRASHGPMWLECRWQQDVIGDKATGTGLKGPRCPAKKLGLDLEDTREQQMCVK